MPLDDRPARRAALAMLLTLGLLPGCSGAGGGSAPAPDAGRAVAQTFLDQIRNGQVDAAWDATTAEFKSMLGKEGLRSYVKKNPEARAPAEFVACTPRPANGLPLAEATFRPAKGTKTLKVLLGKEGADWKVERFTIE